MTQQPMYLISFTNEQSKKYTVDFYNKRTVNNNIYDWVPDDYSKGTYFMKLDETNIVDKYTLDELLESDIYTIVRATSMYELARLRDSLEDIESPYFREGAIPFIELLADKDIGYITQFMGPNFHSYFIDEHEIKDIVLHHNAVVLELPDVILASVINDYDEPDNPNRSCGKGFERKYLDEHGKFIYIDLDEIAGYKLRNIDDAFKNNYLLK